MTKGINIIKALEKTLGKKEIINKYASLYESLIKQDKT
jgi:hypothetical protein|tara:strand:- start:25 stop:138 length:114 start_codon:yes stop_codon:yes gene_type:complete